ncbi:MarR family transcriptional regulator [Sphingobium sp. AP49]|uniref:MarR family winged helix-turn-helix transcriptional regulator n=1 Tax=Sphingobium sp. AP49 TaxID=1144307 RepID=UPI00026EE3E2|nr:MarR family transcriptional regulator [Sphingobium sp. AP49]WHO39208.1 MarR family transcriptional regulator [Sphingobium sp. AP49]
MNRTDLKRALAHNMPQVARLWRQLADSALAEFGVSNSAGWCLLYLDRLGPDVRQIELAEELGITQPSLVRTLDQLQLSALVERCPHPDDRRSNIITLTTSGRDLVGRIETRLQDMRNDLLDGVPDADIETAVNLLDLLRRRIGERRGQS